MVIKFSMQYKSIYWTEAKNLDFCIQLDTIADIYTIKRHPEFDKWFGKLKDSMTRVRLSRRLEKAQRGLLGEVEPVGEGVFEMREFFGPGWRMYYIERGDTLIVMLGGGDKSTQSADIEKAKELSKNLED